ncbi:MAG: ABC transporter permease subunit [Chlorobi bacterium]|nr:ABC transporter permease subunit [Chlorobiota bacterium]
MSGLLRIEWIKARHYSSFRVFIILHFVLFLLVLYAGSRVDISMPGFSTRKVFEFPYVWQSFSWLAGTGFFNLLLAIPMIVLTGNEYAFGTFRQQVFTGLDRTGLFTGKMILMLILAGYGFMLVVFSSLFSGLIFTPQVTLSNVLDQSWYALLYFVKACAVLLFGYLMAVIFRNNALAIVLFLLYFVLIEPVLRLFFPPEARLYFPARIISHLTPTPEFLSITSQGNESLANSFDLGSLGLMKQDLSLQLNFVISLGYMALFAAASFFSLRRRDL